MALAAECGGGYVGVCWGVVLIAGYGLGVGREGDFLGLRLISTCFVDHDYMRRILGLLLR